MKTTGNYIKEVKKGLDIPGVETSKKTSSFKDMLSKHLSLSRGRENGYGNGAKLKQEAPLKAPDEKDLELSLEDFDDETIELLKNLNKFSQTDPYFKKSNKIMNLAENYSGRVGKTLEKRLSKYSHLVEEKAKKYNVDPVLLASLIKQESNFNPYAVSHCGAMGLGQLMPGTARYLGVKDPFNAAQNLDGAAKYLSEQLKTFGGDIKKALAAYNAGPGAVKKYGGIPPYAETQNYVKSILSHYAGINNSGLIAKKS